MEKSAMASCEHFVEYMTGEMSDVERKRFERHMEVCAVCLENAAEWRLVWDRLSEQASLEEPPPELKQTVMAAIFQQERADTHQTREPDSGRPRNGWRKFAIAAAIAAAFMAGFAARTLIPSDGPSSAQIEAAPAHIEKLYQLFPVSEAGEGTGGTNAYGFACVLDTGGEQRLVVYVFGVAKTEGREAYHAWLLTEGERSRAGTFTVNGSGIGLLSVPWTESAPMFDQVGITLEPEADMSSPTGSIVFSSVRSAEG